MARLPYREPAGRGLWSHSNFLRLWAAQAVSAFGTRITRTALPIIAVSTLQQSEVVVATLAATQLIPGAVLVMIAGGFVDRGRKRRILIAADLIRAGLVGSLTIAWALDALSMLQVVVVGAGVGALSALFQITDVAYLPALIGRGHLAEGNAKLETTEAIAEITGPASAGVLIAALGAPLAVAIDAASYLWSAVLLGRIAAPAPAESDGAAIATSDPDGAAIGDDPPPVWTGQDFWLGLRTVFGHPLIRPIVLTLMVWSITGGCFLGLYTLLCLRTLGLSEATFGVIIAMGGIGSLAGAMVARGLAHWLGVGRTIFATSVLSLACTMFVPIASLCSSRPVQVGFLAAQQLLGDGFAVAFIILSVTLRQTVLPKHVLGRANAAVHVCTSGVLPIFAVLAGGLAALIGVRAAVWTLFSIGLTAPVFAWRLRHLRAMPSGELTTSEAMLARAAPGS
jgi:MFS family permease